MPRRKAKPPATHYNTHPLEISLPRRRSRSVPSRPPAQFPNAPLPRQFTAESHSPALPLPNTALFGDDERLRVAGRPAPGEKASRSSMVPHRPESSPGHAGARAPIDPPSNAQDGIDRRSDQQDELAAAMTVFRPPAVETAPPPTTPGGAHRRCTSLRTLRNALRLAARASATKRKNRYFLENDLPPWLNKPAEPQAGGCDLHYRAHDRPGSSVITGGVKIA